jgi:hypothetical protein
MPLRLRSQPGQGADDLSTNLRTRAWQGIFATALWVILTVGVWPISLPLWLAIWYPLPVLLLAADALGPSPVFVRLGLRPTWRPFLLVEVLILTLAVLAGISAVVSPTPRSDQPLTLACAARDLLHGHDPYATFEPQCLNALDYRGVSLTPLRSGPFAHSITGPSSSTLAAVAKREESRGTHAGFPAFGYPPEAILTLLPVAYDSWTAVALWVALLCALLLLAIYLPRPRAPTSVIVWQLAALALVWFPFGWNPELVGYLLIGVSFSLIHLRRISSVALGLAVLTTPMGWVAAPIHLALSWGDPHHWRRYAAFLATLLVGALPWWIWDHALPVQLWRFITLPEFPTGAAVGMLVSSQSTLKPLLLVAFLLAIAACAYVAVKLPQWGWAMAALVWGAFLVSWRAPLYYYDAAFWLSPAVLAGWIRVQRLSSTPLADAGPDAYGAADLRAWTHGPD